MFDWVNLETVAVALSIAYLILAMKENLANDLNSKASLINIKATTTEGMGFIGRGEGIAAHAVALLFSA